MWRPAQLLGAVVLLAQRSAVVAKKPHICFILADVRKEHVCATREARSR